MAMANLANEVDASSLKVSLSIASFFLIFRKCRVEQRSSDRTQTSSASSHFSLTTTQRQ